MRPRLFTAENMGAGLPEYVMLFRFNEAAAIHRGKLGYFAFKDGAEEALQ